VLLFSSVRKGEQCLLLHLFCETMNTNSPFGGVSGLSVTGTELRTEVAVKLAVALEIDEGVNRVNMKPTDNKFVQWDGVGTVTYSATLPSGTIVDAVFSYAHLLDDGTIHLSTTIHFNPHGYVTLPDTTLSLNRVPFLFRIPYDVVEEQFAWNGARATAMSMDANRLEVIYGKRISGSSSPQTTLNYQALAVARGQKRARQFPAATTSAATITTDVVALDKFGSFLDEKRKLEAADKKHAEEVLMPKWGDEILAWVRKIFRTPSRVRQLVRQWQVHPPHEGKNSSDIFARFIEAILRTTGQLQITDTHVRFFADSALAIPVSWLTTEEHIWINKLFVARTELFGQVVCGFGSSYMLARFRLDGVIKAAICQRFIVHQFALDCIEHGIQAMRPLLVLTLVSAVGACYVRNKRDIFLARLVSAVEQPSIHEDVQQMGMFVKIGDSDPEYDFAPVVGGRHGLRQSGYVGRIGNDLSRLPTLPTTPFILK
jgi:hypothetical protein